MFKIPKVNIDIFNIINMHYREDTWKGSRELILINLIQIEWMMKVSNRTLHAREISFSISSVTSELKSYLSSKNI